jgi:choloylglycine hydrolase
VVHTDYTQMTMVRDPASLRYYWRTYDDQTIRMVDLTKFDLNANELKIMSTKSKQSFVDMTGQIK